MIWHACDAKSFHVDSKVKHKFCDWAEKKSRSDEPGHVLVTRSKTHYCLGMILCFNKNHHVGVDEIYYQESVGEEFPD